MRKRRPKSEIRAARKRTSAHWNPITFLVGTITGAAAFAASILAIIAYRSPSSFPVVDGIDLYLCADWIPNAPDTDRQRRFLDELAKRNGQVVFINELTIYNFGCWQAGAKIGEALRKKYSNELFEYVGNDLDERGNGGSLTIGFKKFYPQSNVPGSYVHLVVGAPKEDNYFSDDTCGENCFGANGLYRVSTHYAEGYSFFRLAPFPASSSSIEAYQCTLERITASNYWESLTACRF